LPNPQDAQPSALIYLPTAMLNRVILTAALIGHLTLPSYADSGGPYVGVPDATPSERGPIFQIPKSEQPLRHYLTHMPKLVWNQRLNEPDTFTWIPISGCHASVHSLGYIGNDILCVRYISDQRLDQGLDYAETILILTRKEGTTTSPALCVPIFFSNGGPGIYNLTAEASPAENEGRGTIKITGRISGTGGFRDETHLQLQDGKFVRFTPTAPATPKQ
jgi:hypothetical protein